MKRKWIVIIFLLNVIIIYLTCHFNRVCLDGIEGELLGVMRGADTKYSPEYSHKKFNSIRIGMTEDEVGDILGVPIIKWLPYRNNKYFPEKNDYVGFQYSESPSSTHYRLRQIYFSEGRVAEIKSYFYVD